MKISAIRNNNPKEESNKMVGGESNDSDLLETIKNSKKARKNKRSSSAATTTTLSTAMRNTSDEESECDEKVKVKKRFIKAKVLSSPPPITLTLKKTSDSGAFMGESSNVHDNNSYLSSSDNELPALVNAAIKCVESDSGSNNDTVTPSKIQYTSSLLQDYMEKTQLLAQDPSPTNKDKKVKEVVKRKRGRPKKNTSLVLETDSGE